MKTSIAVTPVSQEASEVVGTSIGGSEVVVVCGRWRKEIILYSIVSVHNNITKLPRQEISCFRTEIQQVQSRQVEYGGH